MGKGNKKIAAGVIAAAVVAIGGYAAYSNTLGKSEEQTVTPPSVSTVVQGDISKRVSASGTVKAADEYSIFIELSQEVETVYAEVGDTVEEGQLLVTYDIADTKKELENKMSDAQIQLQNAQISLQEIATPASGTELLDLQSAVVTAEKNLTDAKNEITTLETKITEAQTDLKNAKKTMEDNEELLKVGGVSQSEYDTSIESYQKAETALAEAKKNKESKALSLESLDLAVEKAKLNLENGQNKLNDTTTANSYKKQQNSVKLAQMTIQSIQDDLNKLTEATYSPISGTIIESNAVEGQMLTDSTVMMKVADLTNLDVNAYVSEYDIAQIQVGQKVELTSDGIEDKIYHGTVMKIEPTAESQSTISGSETVVPIVVHMDDPDELVKPGFSFDLEIITVDLTEVSYIPVSAVLKDRESGETYVFTVDQEEKLVKTPVTLGTYSDVNVELVDGLTEHDRFMTSPDDAVKEGTSLMEYAKTSTSTKKSEESSSILDSVGGGGQGGGMPGGGGPGGAGPGR